MNFIKSKFSILAIALTLIAAIIIDASLKLWEKENRVIQHDVVIYYSYLPATFIFKDIQLKNIDNYKKGNEYLVWPMPAPNGGRVFKMTMGLSMLYLPFFAIGHVLANLLGYEAIGFSSPYKFMLLLSSLFYFAIGLIFLRKILLKYFTENVTGFTILLLGLGTNVLCYASQSAPMPHVYSFALISVFIWLSLKWLEKPKLLNSIFIGLILGLISLIRPTNAVIILLVLLYGVYNISAFRERFIFLLKKTHLIAIIGFCAIIIWMPQFLYWKLNTGSYFYFSYGEERFFWDSPVILKGLFSFRKGWLVYTPVMLFSLIALFFIWKEIKQFRLAIIVFFFVNIYFIFSWWCWWYGGTYGQRPMIDSYALMVIPLAAFVKFIGERRFVFKLIFTLICGFFIWLNIFQTFQFEYFSLHWDSMSQKLYFKQFGKLDPIPDQAKYLDWIDYNKALKGER